MLEKIRKYQGSLLVALIVLCLGGIFLGGMYYLRFLEDSLEKNAAQNVMDDTLQQRNAFDDFFLSDQDRLHSYADFLSSRQHVSSDDLQQVLNLFRGLDAECLVLCLDEGWACGSMHRETLRLEDAQLEEYAALPERGILENFAGLFSGAPQFCYYERFTFPGGHQGIIQKAYDRSKILEAFTLSLYDGQGFGYVLDAQGDILLRSVQMPESRSYGNIFDALRDTHSNEGDIDRLAEAFQQNDTGSIAFNGDGGEYLYTYAPLHCVSDWMLLSIVPAEAIQAETNALMGRTQIVLAIFVSIFIICLLFFLFAWRSQRTMRQRELEAAAQQKKMQESLAEALRMAQAANEAKTAFLSNVSHDIRTPMNAIIGFLALMKTDVDNPEVILDYVGRIEAASQHLLGLINDVLDMNKIESGSTSLSISEMDMATVIEEINTIIRPQAKEKHQSFDIFAPHMKHEHLIGDKMRINQVLINLLSNAVKYTPEGGAIQLRVEEMSQVVDHYSRVRFTVSDNGLGMSEDYQKVLFDPFTREKTKTVHEIQGTGLGMAITKSLVDLMGGTIRVESTPGEGSTFLVELELRIQDVEDDAGFWDEHKVKRMIVADDDEEVCRGVRSLMEAVGVQVDYATGGAEAIRMMRENREAGRPYDLILLDWQMPDLDGLETARLIRRNYPDKIPILLLTAYDWGDIEQEAMEVGVSHFMPKPFFMSTFKEAIRRVMGSGPRRDAPAGEGSLQGRHFLVVDDIEVNRIILVKILGSLGASCDTASNGQEAVERFGQSAPGTFDLILMDVQMPVMGGYDATRAIRAGDHPDAASIPIIAMTANAFVDDVRDAMEAGMDAHIAKPVQLDKLKATIRQVLEGR